jgi:iron(III) transport system substrate-binding protein
VLQVQSAADPPKKLLLGERAVKERGKPVEVVYAMEGSPLIIGPSAVFRNAPNPSAARLSWRKARRSRRAIQAFQGVTGQA